MHRLGLLVCLGFVACGGGTPAPMMVMQMVGANGGTVAASDGTKVELPAGALATDVTIGIAAAANAPAVANVKSVGLAYTFTPEGTSFAKPITVTLAFDPAKLPAGKTASNIVIYKAPAGTASYTALPTTVVDATHVSATTQSFSTFQSGAAEGGGGCEPTCTAADGGCACTSTCGGKTYSLVCTMLGACQCNENGTAGNVVEVAGCSNLTALKMTFSAPKNINGCGFPTAAP